MTDDVDDLDRATAEARRIIARKLTAMGLADEVQGLHAVAGSIGDVLVYRTRTVAGGETTEAKHLTANGDPDQPLDVGALRDLDTMIRRHARRTLRHRAIARTGHGGEEPVWAHTMHRVMRRFVMEKGLDPAMMVAGPDQDDATRRNIDYTLRYMADQSGLSLGKDRQEDGRLDFDSVIDGDIQIIGGGRPALLLGRTLPESFVAALPGRLLSEVIDHPAIRRAGPVRIEEAEGRPGLVTIVMADVQDFIRRPPAGFDRKWSRIRFTPEPIT